MRISVPLFRSCSLAVMLACACVAGVVTEVGDAGNNTQSAQMLYGTGPLTEIHGTLKASGDSTSLVDVFGIYVTSPLQFYAITSGNVPDPALFIFDAAGHPLEGNRDISANNKQAFLTGGDAAPGIYYIWISTQDREPGGYVPGPNATPDFLFPPSGGIGGMFFPFNDNSILTGPIGNENSLNSAGGNYSYTITLTATSFVPVPEPGTWGMMVAAAALAGVWRFAKRS